MKSKEVTKMNAREITRLIIESPIPELKKYLNNMGIAIKDGKGDSKLLSELMVEITTYIDKLENNEREGK